MKTVAPPPAHVIRRFRGNTAVFAHRSSPVSFPPISFVWNKTETKSTWSEMIIEKLVVVIGS